MDITLNLSPLINLFYLPPDQFFLTVMLNVGWIPIVAIFIKGMVDIWVYNRQNEWHDTVKMTLLAIDLPRINNQTPKAAENMFSYLGGAHGSLNLIEEYIEGKFQLSISYEIVSIGGQTQFLIRTPEMFRNIIETSVYSQYPDAEITEVDDYAKNFPKEFPSAEYDAWGAEFIQVKSPAYPIRTYLDFEHKMGETETQYKDPMAALMDLCGSLQEGEFLGYQIIVKPIGFDEMKIAEKDIKTIMKEDIIDDKAMPAKIVDGIVGFFDFLANTLLTIFGIEQAEEVKATPMKPIDLKPIEKRMLEKISEKSAKMMFKAKIRFVYLSKKEVMNKGKVVNGFVGFIKQFADAQLNNLKPDTGLTSTSIKYPPFKEYRLNYRKTKIVNNYRNRSGFGNVMGTYSIEELATLWNFPNSSVVRAPSLQKVAGKKSQPPAGLPDTVAYSIKEDDYTIELVDELSTPQPIITEKPAINEEPAKGTPPTNLPFA